jgi:hypothetical protein
MVRRLLPFGAATAFFSLMAMLYLARSPLYFGIIRAWGVNAWRNPFLDTDGVVSALRCLRVGVDVFLTNPCDVLGRVFNYSPLWLVLAWLPVTKDWLVPTGLAFDIAFLFSLLLLPSGRRLSAAVWITLGAISPAVLFAMERGNIDLVMFSLASIAATLACRSPRLRLIGYGAALLAGLLKYYPMTLMLLATREWPRRFLVVTAAAIALTALFLVAMGQDLVVALRLIPQGMWWFAGPFGSIVLPGGIAEMLNLPAIACSVLRLLLAAGALAGGIRLATRRWFAGDLARLTPLEETTLLTGALLILSCFFTAQNIDYRAIHLLLVLPALTALHDLGDARRLHGSVLIGAVFLLWSDAWRLGPYTYAYPSNHLIIIEIGWGLRELIWWWVVTILIAYMIVVLRQSEMGRRILPRLNPFDKRVPSPGSVAAAP